MIVLRWLIAPLVLILQSVLLALGQIRAHKMRSFLTSLGIIIGVASVTAVIAALTGLWANVLSKFENYGANRMFIYPMMPDDGHRHRWAEFMMRPHDFDGASDHCPSVVGVTRTCDSERTVWFGTHSKLANIMGIEPSWHEVTGRPIVIGRSFSLIDNTLPRPVCLINVIARDDLGLDEDPTGQTLLIQDRRFTVVGVVANRGDDPWDGGDRESVEVFVPFKILFHPGKPVWGQSASRSSSLSGEAKAELHAFFRHSRHLGATSADNFEIWAVQQEVDNVQKISAAVTAVAAGIVGISLLVGGIGIMNIMLVSVSERTREIGLRKAVGARPAAILMQFLVEAIVLCLLGGLIGILCGEGITSVLRMFPAMHLEAATVPAWAITLSFGFAAAVGLIFGFFPAIKAARMDPIVALRHE